MPTVYIIAGPNGAGKTTFARQFLAGEVPRLPFINADSIAQGLSPFAPERAAMAAGRLMIFRLLELAKQRRSFAFETTLSGRAWRPLLLAWKKNGYRVELNFLLLPDPRQSVARVAQRVVQGGHHIPEDVIRRRHPRGVKNLLSWYRADLDRWALYDNTRNPASLIACEDSGNLVVSDPLMFAGIEQTMQDNTQDNDL